MPGSVNKAIIVGNLGADPEVRRLQSGDAVVNMRIATSETWRDRQSGERKERTEWHNVVIFNEGLAKVAEQYLRKGSTVYIEGQLQTRSWEDQPGQKKYTTEIVLQKFRGELQILSGRGEGERDGERQGEQHKSQRDSSTSRSGRGERESYGSQKGRSAVPDSQGERRYDLDDEIPF